MGNRVELVCTACTLQRRGIKTSKAPDHTCLKASKNYVEPESKIMGTDKYIEFFVLKCLYGTGKADRFLCAVQIANGQRVKAGTEIWFPVENYIHDCNFENQLRGKRLWIKEKHYLNMVFLP